mmetsp:Transcript_5541/g.13440  ORF Transcript_5541/g.13440 Transcript_5541/m.13440 type:complete len:278 (-) Transcript_5541:56-889(-)
MQIGRVQGLGRAAGRGHQHTDLGEGGAGLVAELGHRALHVAQVGAAVAGLVARQGLVDGLDDRLGVPLGGTPVPVVQPDLATEVQHQGFESRRGVEVEAHLVQFGLGRHQVRPEAPQVFHQHQAVLLLLEEPHAHEGGEVAVLAVVAQEHLGGRQGRPLGDGVHLDRLRLLVGELGGIELVPGNVAVHVPAHGFELLEQFGVKHGESSSRGPILKVRASARFPGQWRPGHRAGERPWAAGAAAARDCCRRPRSRPRAAATGSASSGRPARRGGASGR